MAYCDTDQDVPLAERTRSSSLRIDSQRESPSSLQRDCGIASFRFRVLCPVSRTVARTGDRGRLNRTLRGMEFGSANINPWFGLYPAGEIRGSSKNLLDVNICVCDTPVPPGANLCQFGEVDRVHTLSVHHNATIPLPLFMHYLPHYFDGVCTMSSLWQNGVADCCSKCSLHEPACVDSSCSDSGSSWIRILRPR